MLRAGVCVHWTGLAGGEDLRKRRCNAGVCYYAAFNGMRPGLAWRLPCVQFAVVSAVTGDPEVEPGERTRRVPLQRRGYDVAHCERLRLPSDDEIAESNNERTGTAAKTRALRIAVAAALGAALGLERRALFVCGACGGRLHVHQRSAAEGGAITARCATEGCVEWSE